MKSLNPDSIFEIYQIETDYLRRLLGVVLLTIFKSLDLLNEKFGSIYEGRTFSGEAGEVTEDGDIYLDSNLLKDYEDDVSMAIIAHELAHYYLRHYLKPVNTLDDEHKADQVAEEWGFNIEKFRKTCGQPKDMAL